MKNNGRQRFYLWDYLWWMGEKLKQARRTGRVDGEMMLSIYIFALLIFPLIRQRLIHARLLLISTDKAIAEIGTACAFPNTTWAFFEEGTT